jgi:hypothetical protein
MPSNKNTQSKKLTPKSTEQVSVPEPVVVQPVAQQVAPVVVQPVAQPVEPVVVAQQVAATGKGKGKGKVAPAVVVQQVEAVVQQVAPAVVVQQVAQPVAQEGGAKKAKGGKKVAAAPVVAVVAPVEVAKSPKAKAAKAPKEKAAKAPKEKAVKETKVKEVKPKVAKTKVAKPKVVKSKVAKTTETAEDGSEEPESGKRSFKAQLPASEKYEGRYTGLTPYQAANKALSKYYREHSDNAATEITFSIRESTRGSKRSVYTYNGRREKLAVPVEYTIKGKDGDRTVVKEYKNRLTKVKKADSVATATETSATTA